MTLLLASQSSGRAAMLRAAGLSFETSAAHVDEEGLTAALHAEGQSARNIADALAEAKAVKISSRLPGVTVLGADSTLALDDGAMLTKPVDPAEAASHLRRMAGTRHRLFSAVVAAREGAPVWRAVGEAKLWMRPLSDAFIADYVAREWDSIRWTVGCYEIEGAGVQLFERVEGDPWTIIGMPMLPLLAWLRETGLAAS
ncbi:MULTISPECIES: Maf family protein [unclassified Sphingopyxis]|uniref:Maf family protein n=1 Tax=unclassified Sphingopyxis TaxID=2614943 RepID=UPI00073743CC|nr:MULTISPECIES: Maf family protein [unclassified Sphingopyxis]KTE45720.1 septum formation protein Maf [Sphingopyxis sp. HIX]KTE85602.1 septum formation protein Maf [Sphingopyxis sp. HXXIV]